MGDAGFRVYIRKGSYVRVRTRCAQVGYPARARARAGTETQVLVLRDMVSVPRLHICDHNYDY